MEFLDVGGAPLDRPDPWGRLPTRRLRSLPDAEGDRVDVIVYEGHPGGKSGRPANEAPVGLSVRVVPGDGREHRHPTLPELVAAGRCLDRDFVFSLGQFATWESFPEAGPETSIQLLSLAERVHEPTGAPA